LLAGFYRLGATPDELLLAYPQLSAAARYDALSSYHDHRPELDAALDKRGSLERLRARYGFAVGAAPAPILPRRPAATTDRRPAQPGRSGEAGTRDTGSPPSG
jgi:hypothetical protein